jgi:hypothetical protein
MLISMSGAIKSQVVLQSRGGALRRHLMQDVITDPMVHMAHMVQCQTLGLVVLVQRHPMGPVVQIRHGLPSVSLKNPVVGRVRPIRFNGLSAM